MSRVNRESGLPTRIKSIVRDKLLEVRGLQRLTGMKDSEFFKMVSAIYRDTGGNTTNIFLINLIREIELQERRERING